MRRKLALLLCILAAAWSLRAADRDILIHWSFDEGQGTVTKDLSGNGLNGTVSAGWADSPRGKALLFDGTPKRIVKTRLPEEQRFGRASWTFMAWVKPTQLSIDDRQNQRRLFSFGKYPDAYLVIDLTVRGSLSCYFCYRDKDGKGIATGCSSSLTIGTNQWAHLALVCDRDAGQIRPYINGYSEGPNSMQADFDGNFILGDTLTIGSSWHNYWGVMDEVRIYRRALSKADVRAEFDRFKSTFKVVETPSIAAAKRRERLAEAMEEANGAWSAGDYAAVRRHCETVTHEPQAPGRYRSYAHLRIAQSFAAQGITGAAVDTYREIAAAAAYPAVHRFEARECLRQLERTAKGLPPRDPLASRVAVRPVDAYEAELFVAPDGNDGNDGSAGAPFATPARARDAVRKLKADGVEGAVAVTLKPGRYSCTATLELTSADSGTEAAPIVYRAARKGCAVLYGGKRISGFAPVRDRAVLERLPEGARSKVWQCNLKAQGIEDYGELKVRGFGQPPSPPTLELFFDGRPMTPARWPNEGFVGIRKLVSGGSRAEGTPSVFEYGADRHARWTEAEDGWLFGYFHFLWADATAKIGAIDTKARTLTTAEPYDYGGRGMSTRQGILYYAFNLLEEIDRPGEWHLDRNTGVLYLYPPSDPGAATVEIGVLSAPMITMNAVSHVRVEGLVFDLARYNGIVMNGCRHCLVAGCTVGRVAGNGIMVHGGERNGLLGCDIHTIGRRATEVIGGDRRTLTPAGHFVENCRIHDFGRVDRTYTPAIQLEGVGNRVAHNLLYDGPSSVMRIEGNDHAIEFNDVHSAVRESDDQGAMELFRNATYRGVVFRYNRFRNVGKTGAEHAVHGQAAIRFDDAISGMVVYGNVFERCANGRFGAIQMNSGRDNIMDNNLFIDCKQGLSGGWNRNNKVWKTLRAGNLPHGFYTNELYLSRYPAMTHWLDEPAVNHVWRNVFYRCGRVATGNRAHLDLFANGVFDETDPGFINAADGDFRLRPDATLFATVGFRPIPVDEIGLYEDAYRATWPVETTPVKKPDWR